MRKGRGRLFVGVLFAGERLVRVACFLNLDEAGTNLFTNIPGPWPQIFLLTEKHVNGACRGYKLKSRCWFEQLSALKSCLVFVLRLCHLVVYFTLIETHVAP